MVKSTLEAIDKLLTIADDEDTHWRYEIVAIRALRTLIRRDQPPHAPQLEFFMDQALADHPSMRYVSHLIHIEEPYLWSTSVRSTGRDEDIAVYQTQDFQPEQRGYRHPNEPQPPPENSSCPGRNQRKDAILPFPI